MSSMCCEVIGDGINNRITIEFPPFIDLMHSIVRVIEISTGQQIQHLELVILSTSSLEVTFLVPPDPKSIRVEAICSSPSEGVVEITPPVDKLWVVSPEVNPVCEGCGYLEPVYICVSEDLRDLIMHQCVFCPNGPDTPYRCINRFEKDEEIQL